MMARIIKNGDIVQDEWTTLQLAEGETPEAVALPAGRVIFPLPVWQARKADILARGESVGLLLESNERVEELAADLGQFTVIAVNFPKFVHGQGFSTASLLRQRYGYQGELRAVGDVVHDTLFYMKRVGFDAFALKEDKSAEYAVDKGFSVFSEGYQASTDRPVPYFRRRSA